MSRPEVEVTVVVHNKHLLQTAHVLLGLVDRDKQSQFWNDEVQRWRFDYMKIRDKWLLEEEAFE